MTGIIKKIKIAIRNRTTYRVGLLQAKAYRILKRYTSEGLQSHDISTVDWALLGHLNDFKGGCRLSHLAEELGVEAPFVTVLYTKLHKKGLVISKTDPDDSRAKIICLTQKGEGFVRETEEGLKTHMRPLLKGLSSNEVVSYINVLEHIIENGAASGEGKQS